MLSIANWLILIYSRNIMGNILYTIAVVLVIIWLLGYLGVLGTGIATSGLIHVLLVIAVIADQIQKLWRALYFSRFVC